jgi:hypothetical protein
MEADLSSAMVNRYITIIRMLLSEARLRGLLKDHPIPAGIIPPLNEPEVVVAYLSPTERESLLAAFDDEAGFRDRINCSRHLGPGSSDSRGVRSILKDVPSRRSELRPESRSSSRRQSVFVKHFEHSALAAQSSLFLN